MHSSFSASSRYLMAAVLLSTVATGLSSTVQARALVALPPLAEDGSVGRVLGLVEAHLETVEGRYAEAAARVEAIAVEEAEVDPESGMSEALYDLAAVFAERARAEGLARRCLPEPR